MRRELQLSPEQVEAFAQRLYRGVRREVAAYGAITDPETDRDFAEVNRRNIEVFFRALAEDRLPTDAELAIFESAARRRLRQAVPLEAIFRSYRVGVRVMWECLLEVAPQQDHGRLGSLALEYADRVSTAAAQAYVEERHRVAQSREDATRLLLTRLVQSDVIDEEAALSEASELGIDLAEPRFALVVSSVHGGRHPSAGADLALAGVRSRLLAAIPDALVVLLHGQALALMPAASEADAGAAVERALADGLRAYPDHPLAAGMGTPAAGPRGLAASHREAVRAHALGRILEPNRLLHRYHDLSLFDLFKEGDAMEAFVGQVLGPLLDLDGERRRRLLETLETLFATALNRKLAARRIGVHQNTLGLRIRRIEQLLGGSLNSGEFVFRVQLALRLLPLRRAAPD
jgi:sugar diacid utilization regulator